MKAWMKGLLGFLAVTSLGFGAQALASEQIRCESFDHRYNSCPVRRSYTNVTLLEQLSGSACVKGHSFGLAGGVVWVDRGCRGIFLVSRDRFPDDGRMTRCESHDYGLNSCYVGRHRYVELFRQLSNAPCDDGYSWGYDPYEGFIWVDRGCRADFYVER